MNPAPLLFAFIMLGLMYFVVIAPQQKRLKAHNEVVARLSVGLAVVTTSGLCGTISSLNDEWAELEVANGVTVKFDRRAIGVVLDPADDLESARPTRSPTEPSPHEQETQPMPTTDHPDIEA